jgi:hypothetical protein
VIFMGVFYHLRHPLLALDLIREHVAGDRMLFQTMQRGSEEVFAVPEDYPFHEPGTYGPPPFFNEPGYPRMHFIERSYSNDWTNWWGGEPRRVRGDAARRGVRDRGSAGGRGLSLPRRADPVRRARQPAGGVPREGGAGMSVEAAMIWNEPNNKSHWDPEVDPDWGKFAQMAVMAGNSIRAVNPHVKRVLGGMSPIDAHWVEKLRPHGVLDAVDVVAVHGFRSTGICGRSTPGPTRSPRSRRSCPITRCG